MNKIILIISFTVLTFLFSCGKDNSTEIQPDKPGTKTIGSQVWQIRNLDVDHYRNGDSIPEVRDSIEWKKLTSGAWCYYNNDTSNGKIYGKLYNWYAVNDPRGLAPSGWHVPSEAEWTTLTNFLGGESIAGGKLKETGTEHWQNQNEETTNSSGFTALPGGWREGSFGRFEDVLGNFGYWWSSTEKSKSVEAWGRNMYSSSSYIERHFTVESSGVSVRCVRDN